jgi:hypothetical protein
MGRCRLSLAKPRRSARRRPLECPIETCVESNRANAVRSIDLKNSVSGDCGGPRRRTVTDASGPPPQADGGSRARGRSRVLRARLVRARGDGPGLRVVRPERKLDHQELPDMSVPRQSRRGVRRRRQTQRVPGRLEIGRSSPPLSKIGDSAISGAMLKTESSGNFLKPNTVLRATSKIRS